MAGITFENVTFTYPGVSVPALLAHAEDVEKEGTEDVGNGLQVVGADGCLLVNDLVYLPAGIEEMADDDWCIQVVAHSLVA